MIVEVDGVRLDVPDDATPDEIDALSKPVAAPKEKTLMDSVGEGVNSFFGAGPVTKPQTMLPVVKGMAKAGAFLVPGSGIPSMLASGAAFGAGASDKEDPAGIAMDAGKTALIGAGVGKALQVGGKAIWNATTAPERVLSPLRQKMYDFVSAQRPIIKVAPNPIAAAPAVLASPVESGVQRVLSSEDAVGVLPRIVTGDINPTSTASALRAKGIRLTRGQQDPFSPANQLEQALQSVNSRIMQQRGTGVGDLQIAALNEAIPPGAKKIPIGTPFDEAMGTVHDAFGKAYNKIGDVPVYPAVHGPGGGPLQGTTQTPGLMEQAVASVKRLSPSQRDSITADVLDQLGRIPERKGAVGQLDAGDLLNVRSIIRTRAREFRADHSAESSAAAEAYEAAEDTITAALKSQLPPSYSRTLDKTDAAYRNFKTVDSAVMSARSQADGFTPSQLARAAAKGASGTQLATREAGPLYDLGIAGADVFRQTSRPTGERLATLQALSHGIPIPESVRHWFLGHAVERANAASMSSAPKMVEALMRNPITTAPTYPAPGPSLPGQVALAPRIGPELKAWLEALQQRAGGLGVSSVGADER
jgi:hypothetical protein